MSCRQKLHILFRFITTDRQHNLLATSFYNACTPPPSKLFYYSAALVHIAIVPKHIYVGATVITEAIEAIPNQPRYTVAKSIFKTVWNHGNADV
jgi:hypothetical protein